MATLPISEALLRQAVDAWARNQRSVAKAAAELGLNYNTYKYRLDTAKQRGMHLSEGAARVVTQAQLAPLEARGGWLHSYNEDGKKIGATFWKPQEDTLEDVIEKVRTAFTDLPPAPPASPPERYRNDLCTVLPFFDVHFGMRAWGRETGGQDYDVQHAARDLRSATDAVLTMTPNADTCIILAGGDFFHADDTTAQTPASKHALDVDGRHFHVLTEGVAALAHAIERARQTHARTVVRVLRGNHDPHAHLVLIFALAERYRTAEGVQIDQDPRDLFLWQWGRCGIYAHHGDKHKPMDFAMKVADVSPFWSAAPHRYAYLGHLHNFTAQRVGGLYLERLDAFAPPDSYGATWVNRRAMRADVYHKESGRIMSIFDPIERRS